MDNNALLTVQEVAQRLAISKYQVYRRIARGNLPATAGRQGSTHYLISEEDLNEYIAAGGAEVLAPPRRDYLDWLPVSEVARMTGFSSETVRLMCQEGRLPYIRGKGPRGHLRIPRHAVDGFLSSHDH